MSEYMQPAKKPLTDSIENTLFDDTLLDDMADKVGSYDDARRLLGLKTPTYETPESTVSSDGASVKLASRALAASNIMATYNQLNKTMGARIASQQPGNDFVKRYDHPEQVTEHMGGKASGMIHRNDADFDTLNATKAMIEAGFDEEMVIRQKDILKRKMINKYGPGKAYAPGRRKFITHLNKNS